MSTILVPVDFSPSSENATRYAMELAKKRNAVLLLLNIYPIPISTPDAPAEIILAEEIREDASARFEVIKNDLVANGVNVKTKLVAGSAGSEIAYVADQTHPDLIVMGTHGASAKKSKWLGGNTMHVIDRTHSPLLAVPDGAVFKPWQKIVCATDFDYHEIDSIKDASDWIKVFDAELILAHVHEEKSNTIQDDAAYRESFIEKIQDLTGIQKIDYQYLGAGHNIIDRLREFSYVRNADALILLHKIRKGLSRLWQKSLTKEMANELRIPLLSYPIKEIDLAEDDGES